MSRPQRCKQCNGRFGLVSYFWFNKRFCRKACRILYRHNIVHPFTHFFDVVEAKLLHR